MEEEEEEEERERRRHQTCWRRFLGGEGEEDERYSDEQAVCVTKSDQRNLTGEE